MRKRYLIIGSILLILGIVIINRPRSGVMRCIYTSSNDVMDVNSIYKIIYKKNNVTELYTKEEIISNDKDMLDNYKLTLDYTYSKYDDLDNYNNKVILKNKKLTTITRINYDKIDIDKFISIDKSNKKLFTDSHVKLKTLKNIYEEKGAKCRNA